ncbi:hypothetical protein BKA93DRAFT_457437 [Sparassis latifolia]|uniref:DUF4470 domain-containing protein n=1 Tax=Sparassis crispa TaxID=139825 RepID=A0A401H6M0_9APHY|nr:hypothetical protein SCP_1801220 [Sparassis crispa]GBE90098.1 hypothetical protein SCP_1801220 [Sparassis crispa]
MAAKKAVVLKNRGNDFFKSGRLSEAASLYSEAEKLSPSDPVYASNLSAALYEASNYPECIDAIIRSYKLINSGSNSVLASKLSARLCKALCHGLRSGAISDKFIRERADDISRLETVLSGSAESDPKSSQVWQLFRAIESESGDRRQTGSDALGRLSCLPVFKKPPSFWVDYHTIGQDSVMSMIDDAGPESPSRLDLSKMSDDELGDIAFMFGGIGDARHVFGTIYRLQKVCKELPQDKRDKVHMHMTLLDFHPGALARDLCVLMLLHDLVEAEATDPIALAEMKATLFYTYVGIAMPEYCHERLQNVIKDLQSRLSERPSRFPSWIHVDTEAVPGILEALKVWSTIADNTNTAQMLAAHHPISAGKSPLDFLDDPKISPAYKQMIEKNLADKRLKATEVVRALPPETLEKMGLVDPGPDATPRQKRLYKECFQGVVDSTLELVFSGTGTMSVEKMWYDQNKVFLPPPELWSRHPGFEDFAAFKNQLKKAKPSMAKSWKKHIEQTWKPNPTLYDYRHPGREPFLGFNPWNTPGCIDKFNVRFGFNTISPHTIYADAPTYTHLADFFGAVADSLKILKGQLKLELLFAELTQESVKMRFNSDHTRSPEFPRTFTRSYVSNVPDYTHGTINMLLYSLPLVRCGRESVVSAHSLLNTGIWRDDEEFIYTYTLLRSTDIPRYFGCRLISKEAVHRLVVLGNKPLPRPLSELATREELVVWLTRTLIYTVIPGTSGLGYFRAKMPNNLIPFFTLLVHLHSVGYPAHWLSEFLQCILDDDLTTDIAPYLDKWPIPVSDINRRVPKRKIRLDILHAEFENVLALSHRGFPFAISLPADFVTSHKEVGVFEASVRSSSPMLSSPSSSIPPFDPAVYLLFYKPAPNLTASAVVTALPSILDGKMEPPPGEIYILTAQETFDLDARKVSWMLSKRRARKMKREGWVMVAYRTDCKEPMTHPVPASQWEDTSF